MTFWTKGNCGVGMESEISDVRMGDLLEEEEQNTHGQENSY